MEETFNPFKQIQIIHDDLDQFHYNQPPNIIQENLLISEELKENNSEQSDDSDIFVESIYDRYFTQQMPPIQNIQPHQQEEPKEQEFKAFMAATIKEQLENQAQSQSVHIQPAISQLQQEQPQQHLQQNNQQPIQGYLQREEYREYREYRQRHNYHQQIPNRNVYQVRVIQSMFQRPSQQFYYDQYRHPYPLEQRNYRNQYRNHYYRQYNNHSYQQQHEQYQAQVQGLRKQEINTLIQIEYSSPQAAQWDEECKRCSICLMDFARKDRIRFLPCLHRFHLPCIDKWLANHNVCPLCKKDIKKLIQEMNQM